MPSSTSSSSPGSTGSTAAAWGVVWALVWLLLAELGVHWGYTPQHVDSELYAANFPDHRYGFDRSRPRCWPGPGVLECFGDQYQRIPDQTLTDPKPPGSLRIIVVGSSPSHGAHAYPTQIAAPIQALTGRPVEVLNFSVRGDGSARILGQLDEALTLDADVLVIHPHGTNEFEDERDHAQMLTLHEGVLGLVRSSEYANVAQKLVASHLLPLAAGLVAPAEPLPNQGGAEARASKDPDNVARWRESVATNTRRMVDRARAAGVVVVLVGRAERPAKPGTATPWIGYVDEILVPLADADPGVYYFDTMAALAAGPRDLASSFVDTTHFSSSGHALLSKALAKAIADALAAGD